MSLLYLLCFLFLNGAISQSQSWVTAYDQTSLNAADPLWKTFSGTTLVANTGNTCGSQGYLFGYNSYGLSGAHSVTWGPFTFPYSNIRGVRVIASFIALDTWDPSERLFVSYKNTNGTLGSIGSVLPDRENFSLGNLCGASGGTETLMNIDFTSSSLNLQSLTLTLNTNLNSARTDESWGIKSFRVEVLRDCNTCTDNNNQQCDGSPIAVCTTTAECQRICTCPQGHTGTSSLIGPNSKFAGCEVQSCTKDSDCYTGFCDEILGKCYQECIDPPSNSSCPIHNFRSSEDLIIPYAPQFSAIFNSTLKSFVFNVATTYTRTNTSYVLGLDEFIDNRAIRDVGLCENRDPLLFPFDNRGWWCSPSDAYGIGSSSFLAWGPSMSWNQTALACNSVLFTRAFTISDLTKKCSKPGSVTVKTEESKIVYDGTFHVTLAQEDFEWTPTSLIPLAKWNFPFKFSFTRNFTIVACFVAERISTKVKQGVSVVNKTQLHIFVDTRIEKLYGPYAYVVLDSGVNTTNNFTIFRNTTSNSLVRGLQNGPEGTRTHQPGGSSNGTGCVFPTCQQVWNFLSDPIPQNATFAGVYSITFRVRNSSQSPTEDIDYFTISLTLDSSFVPEKTTEIDNIDLGSRLSIYANQNFNTAAPATGFRNNQTAYVVQNISLNTDDRDLWFLQLINATICVPPNGTFGCDNATEKYLIYSNSITAPNASSFRTVFYSPGTVPGHAYVSATGLSFSVAPLTNKYPLRRTYCIQFVSLASLASGTGTLKRDIQQNAKVSRAMMFNIQNDRVITDYETNDEVTKEGSRHEMFTFGSNLMIAVIGFALAGTVMLVVFISFLVFRYKTTVAKKDIQAVRLNADSETESESEAVAYL